MTKARGWWKRGDVAASATHANMACWVHQDSILDDEEVSQSLQEAWENEGSNDEPKIELHGLFRHLGKCICFPALPTAFQIRTSLDGSSVSREQLEYSLRITSSHLLILSFSVSALKSLGFIFLALEVSRSMWNIGILGTLES